jgi:type II restriction/modification system DNA methylase subunit YeeA
MTPQDFIHKWRPSQLRERQASQEHFLDLCHLLGEPTPAEIDIEGNSYCFDYGASKTGGDKEGFADVWKKGCFGWEYKGKHKDLIAAYVQIKEYVDDLQNPPLLIVSDMDRIVIRTNFTNTVQEIHTISLDDLILTEKRRLLKWAFSEPERFRPNISREELTEAAARQFSDLAQRLRDKELDPPGPAKKYEPIRVAHFMIKMLFCMFAEHINILPSGLFTRLLEAASRHPQEFQPMARDLFSAMRKGGRFGAEIIDWFNGGLFDDDDTLELEKPDIDQVLKISQLDWSAIEPSIFGTLFERGLDPDKRSQLGAHFTDQQSILRIVEPVVLAPLRAEWEAVKAKVSETMGEYRRILDKPAPPTTTVQVKFGQKTELHALASGRSKAATSAAANKLQAKAKDLCREFLHRLENYRVLDPACGSGNFLYLSLLGLKDLEHSVIMEAEELGLERSFPAVGPQSVMGIELNLYAAELARVTIWIGQIQWMLRHGWGLSMDPILKPLDQISCRDALLNPDGTEAEWPSAHCIVTNPPFLGDKRILSELGEEYTTRLRQVFSGRVPASADLVTYWFRKAWEQVAVNQTDRAGLVATQSIRKGNNRAILDVIAAEGQIVNAWSDEPWVLEGAAVRVSIVCFARRSDCLAEHRYLDGKVVQRIFADLNSQALGQSVAVDFTQAQRVLENVNICFQGPVKVGPFDIPGNLARAWLTLPANPGGRPNKDVVRPWANGKDLSGRASDTWIIDFGVATDRPQAAQYEKPFEYVVTNVKERRDKNNDKWRREHWWLHGRSGEDLRSATLHMKRYICTPRVAKHRYFVWLHHSVLPDSRLNAIAREDDTTFGILQSRYHLAWALKTSSRHGVGNDPTYNARSVFETYVFPEGLSPNIPAAQYAAKFNAVAISDLARRLNDLRENWLNPPELIKRMPEVANGFPDRKIPINEKAAAELKKRTLNRLYNTRPAWLAQAHDELDAAVAVAYGWPTDIGEEEALRKLLELNLSRSA